MKVRLLLTFAVIALFLGALNSCFLFPKNVTVDDTKSFINDFETTVTDPTSEVEGPNGTLAMGAATDFFSKGGTSKSGNIFPSVSFSNFLRPEVKSVSLLLDTIYGTFVYDTIYDTIWGYEYYDFRLVDANSPANGYLFQWLFTDTTVSPAENHEMSFLFDSITYFAGDQDEETPTRLYVALQADDEALMWANFHMTYTTLSDEYDTWFSPVTLATHFEIKDETAIEIDYVGHNDGDTTVVIDSLRTKLDDLFNDQWVEYTVKMNDDESTDFTMENQEGWFMAINALNPVEVDTTYTKTDFTGEVQKSGTHAADLEGYLWFPSDYFLHKSLMFVTYPDGSKDTVDLTETTATLPIGK